jgi:acyl carrier protein
MIMQVIRNALINELGIEETLIRPEAKIEADLELDSTETVIIALEIKKKFGIDYIFPAEDVTLQAICDYVKEKQATV